MKVNQGISLAEVALEKDGSEHQVVAHVNGQSLTHEQWLQQVHAWRTAFSQVIGSEVAMYFEDAVMFSAALWGAWHAGKTPVLLGDTQPHTLECVLPTVQACAGDLPGALTPLSGKSDCISSCAVPTLSALDLQNSKLILFTSGSTGQPDRITKHLRQLDAEVHALQAAFGHALDGDCHTVSTVSHQHIYGLLFRVLWPLSAGRLVGVHVLRYPEELVVALAAHPRNVLVSSPAFLSRLPIHLDWLPVRAQLVQVFSSGGPLAPEAALLSMQCLSASPTEVFGSSETGGIAWRRRAEHGDTWQLLPGVSVQVLSGETLHVDLLREPDKVNDEVLTVQSPHLPDPFVWWPTHDRAKVSSDGRSFVLLGRADHIVKIAEKRVSLTAIELALQALDCVQYAKGVVLKAHEPSARIGMVLELSELGWQQLMRQGRRAMAQSLRQHLSKFVERVALPRSWRYVQRMPVNAQSKITHMALQQLFHPTVPQPHWLERSAESAVAMLWVDPQLRVLEGHFPQATLVPGVAQLHWVVQMGQQAFGIEPKFTKGEVLKFQQPILPGDTVKLELRWDARMQRLQFALTSERGPHASGKLVQEAQ